MLRYGFKTLSENIELLSTTILFASVFLTRASFREKPYEEMYAIINFKKIIIK